MSADTADDDDRLDARLSNVEGTMEQMNERLGSIDGRLNGHDDRFDALNNKIDDRFSTLDSKIEQNRREMRRLMIVLIGGATTILTAIPSQAGSDDGYSTESAFSSSSAVPNSHYFARRHAGAFRR